MCSNLTKNLNPFTPQGTISRLPFFLISIAYNILSAVLVGVFCKTLVSSYAEPLLVQGEAPIVIAFKNAPKLESITFVAIILIFSVLGLFLQKKRFLDIFAQKDFATKMSWYLAALLFSMNLYTNLFAPMGAICGFLVSLVYLLFFLFLIFKKGGPKVVSVEQPVEQNAEQPVEPAIEE